MTKSKNSIIKGLITIILFINSWGFYYIYANTPTFQKNYEMNQKYIIGVSNNKSDDTVKSNTYIEDIAKKLSTKKPKTNKSLIKNYCDSVLRIKWFYIVGEGPTKFMYDPKQSLFVLSLCTTIDKKRYENYFYFLQNKDGNYYKKYNLSDFGMPTYEGSSCSISGSMNNCELERYIPTMFNQTINDYINIKQASILGVKNTNFNGKNGMKIEDQANDLMKTRFYDNMLCDINGEKDSKCNYPKTMEHIKKLIKNSAKLIKKSKVVNYDKILLDANTKIDKETHLKSECENESVKEQGKYNILMCGLVAGKNVNMGMLVNTLYNELFYYRLFITYYSTDIRVIKENDSAEKMRQELVRSQDAIDLSLQMLKELYFAYPLHLGFTLYLEDLIGLRKELVKIVTPISTLYDKLRNVQEKSN